MGQCHDEGALKLLICALAFGAQGCPPNDYAVRACAEGNPSKKAPATRDDGTTDVTFLAFGDSQYYLDESLGHTGDLKNDYQVQALNAVPTRLSWHAFGVAAPVSDIRGVIIAGDLTQNGRDARSGDNDEYGAFIEDYGLCANRGLDYPVYEGYGNHDFFEWGDLRYRFVRAHPVADSVAVRNT